MFNLAGGMFRDLGGALKKAIKGAKEAPQAARGSRKTAARLQGTPRRPARDFKKSPTSQQETPRMLASPPGWLENQTLAIDFWSFNPSHKLDFLAIQVDLRAFLGSLAGLWAIS